MTDHDLAALVMSAERRWMDSWVAGPTYEGTPIRRGGLAPDLELTDESGERVKLSGFWENGPALVMMWRHLGCGCGLKRIDRLSEYRTARFLDFKSLIDGGIIVQNSQLSLITKPEDFIPATATAKPAHSRVPGRSPAESPATSMVTCTAPNSSSAPVPVESSRYANANGTA